MSQEQQTTVNTTESIIKNESVSEPTGPVNNNNNISEAKSVSNDTNKNEISSTETPVSPIDKSSSTDSRIMADIVGGSQVRKYLNANVTPYLLQGMRQIANEQPQEPLKALGEYLIEMNKKLQEQSKDI